MLESGCHDNSTGLNILLASRPIQTNLESRGRTGGPDHFRGSPNIDQLIIFDALDHLSHSFLSIHHVRR